MVGNQGRSLELWRGGRRRVEGTLGGRHQGERSGCGSGSPVKGVPAKSRMGPFPPTARLLRRLGCFRTWKTLVHSGLAGVSRGRGTTRIVRWARSGNTNLLGAAPFPPSAPAVSQHLEAAIKAPPVGEVCRSWVLPLPLEANHAGGGEREFNRASRLPPPSGRAAFPSLPLPKSFFALHHLPTAAAAAAPSPDPFSLGFPGQFSARGGALPVQAA